jgi:hypothetical protein
MTDWQIRDGEPDTHEDAEYDNAVLGRLNDVHQRVKPVLTDGAAQLPRLGVYADKPDNAHARVVAGDAAWLTRPTANPHHTVWFELHGELILAAGLTREDEAIAGHAQ